MNPVQKKQHTSKLSVLVQYATPPCFLSLYTEYVMEESNYYVKMKGEFNNVHGMQKNQIPAKMSLSWVYFKKYQLEHWSKKMCLLFDLPVFWTVYFTCTLLDNVYSLKTGLNKGPIFLHVRAEWKRFNYSKENNCKIKIIMPFLDMVQHCLKLKMANAKCEAQQWFIWSQRIDTDSVYVSWAFSPQKGSTYLL